MPVITPQPIAIKAVPNIPASHTYVDLSQVEVVTTHFNPCRFKRLAGTYSRWIEKLGNIASVVKCYEVVFDNDCYEIVGATHIPATRELNLMWQKEACLNLALRHCDKPYFVWIDHDLGFMDPYWLDKAINYLSEGYVAVQLFSRLTRLGKTDLPHTNHIGAVAGNHKGNPGAAWIARTDYLREIGGFNVDNLFGGGDQVFLDSLCGVPGYHLSEYSPKMRISILKWITQVYEKSLTKRFTNIDGLAYHFWHGDISDRQYFTRYKILESQDFDPAVDIATNSNGILEWVTDKPVLKKHLIDFFYNRKEDG